MKTKCYWKSLRRLASCLMLAALFAPPVHAQSIGIFLDEDGQTCTAQVGSSPVITLHILAIPGGSLNELTAVQFRIAGVPESWTPQNIVWVPDENSGTSLGNPLFRHPVGNGGPGVAVAFPTCRSDEDPESDTGPVPIGRLLVLGAPTPDDVVLRVEYWELTPGETCPLFVRCDPPYYTTACVEGGQAVLNGDAQGCRIVTGVEEATWTQVRLLYR